jgi:hypothetical protein
VLSLPCRFAFPPSAVSFDFFMCNLIRWHRIISFRLCNSPPRYLVFVRSLAIICASPVVTWVSIPRLCMFDAGMSSHMRRLALWVRHWFPLFPDNTMRRFLKNKIKGKKSSKAPKPEIPTQIADGPPDFPAEPSTASKGWRSLFFRDRGVD